MDARHFITSIDRFNDPNNGYIGTNYHETPFDTLSIEYGDSVRFVKLSNGLGDFNPDRFTVVIDEKDIIVKFVIG